MLCNAWRIFITGQFLVGQISCKRRGNSDTIFYYIKRKCLNFYHHFQCDISCRLPWFLFWWGAQSFVSVGACIYRNCWLYSAPKMESNIHIEYNAIEDLTNCEDTTPNRFHERKKCLPPRLLKPWKLYELVKYGVNNLIKVAISHFCAYLWKEGENNTAHTNRLSHMAKKTP